MSAGPAMGHAACILHISRVVSDLDRSERFYCEGLGFRRGPDPAPTPELHALLGLDPGASISLRRLSLGDEMLELVRVDPPGLPYPPGSRSNDLWFQHLAIVVGDMATGFARVSTLHPARISEHGPVRLPPENGEVTAWKFRDPDGHPLELIHFPPGAGRTTWQGRGPGTLGIDHSALAISDMERSLQFYAGLGFESDTRSLNHGPAQSRLDGLADATVHIGGLRLPGSAGMGLELQAYDPPGRPMPSGGADAAWTDWTTLLCQGVETRFLRDPDDHRILLTARR